MARYLFRKVVAWGRSSNVFLTNGSRLYLDVGSHPEYATAECDSLRQVVAHDRAGERIIEGLVVDAQQRLREDGVAGDPCWPTMPNHPYVQSEGNSGVRGAPLWWPAETDVSIRPGSF